MVQSESYAVLLRLAYAVYHHCINSLFNEVALLSPNLGKAASLLHMLRVSWSKENLTLQHDSTVNSSLNSEPHNLVQASRNERLIYLCTRLELAR